jgi:hypothetical protein
VLSIRLYIWRISESGVKDLADEAQLKILREVVEACNRWREEPVQGWRWVRDDANREIGVPGGVPAGLALDCDDLPGLNGFDAREAGGHEWQQVFQTVRLRTENDNGDLSGS